MLTHRAHAGFPQDRELMLESPKLFCFTWLLLVFGFSFSHHVTFSLLQALLFAKPNLLRSSLRIGKDADNARSGCGTRPASPRRLQTGSRENHLVRAALRHEGRSRQFGTSCSCAAIVAHGCLLMAFCVQEKKPKRKQLQQKHLLRLLGYWNYTVSTSALGELQKYESLVTRRQENDRGRGREGGRERERDSFLSEDLVEILAKSSLRGPCMILYRSL